MKKKTKKFDRAKALEQLKKLGEQILKLQQRRRKLMQELDKS
jgi:predicted  nucleic acid-binding Zn-ribbon protein